jgi:hypothetical protein
MWEDVFSCGAGRLIKALLLQLLFYIVGSDHSVILQNKENCQICRFLKTLGSEAEFPIPVREEFRVRHFSFKIVHLRGPLDIFSSKCMYII